MQIEIRDNRDRAKNAQLLLRLTFATIILSVTVNLFCYFDTNAGLNTVASNIFETRYSLVLRGAVSALEVPVYVLTIVFFIMWFRRSYFNLHQLNNFSLQYTEGWAAGAWFVPFMNLYAPSRIMREIIEDTKSYVIARNSIFEKTYKDLMPYLNWWWGTWIISNIIINTITRINMKASIEDEISTIPFEAIGQIIHLVAAILCIQIIKHSQNVQNDLYDLREEINSDYEKNKSMNDL